MSLVSATAIEGGAQPRWTCGRMTRLRAIAELALAVETGGDVEQAVQAAFMAGVEPQEIADLSGLPTRRVVETLGQPAG